MIYRFEKKIHFLNERIKKSEEIQRIPLSSCSTANYETDPRWSREKWRVGGECLIYRKCEIF